MKTHPLGACNYMYFSYEYKIQNHAHTYSMKFRAVMPTLNKYTDFLKDYSTQNCINYCRKPFELSIIDFCGGFSEDLELCKTLKIKHIKNKQHCQLFIKFKRQDLILVFYLAIAKVFLERGEEWGNQYNYKLQLTWADIAMEFGGVDVIDFICKIDKQVNGEGSFWELTLDLPLVDENHLNEICSTTLYLIENNYNWFWDEYRRQELVRTGRLPPSSY